MNLCSTMSATILAAIPMNIVLATIANNEDHIFAAVVGILVIAPRLVIFEKRCNLC